MHERFRLPILIATLALVCSPAFAQGTKPAPKTAKPPAKAAPATKKPPAPAAVPAPPPAPTDVRYKTRHTTGEEVTESVTFITDQRERYELTDIVLIRQRDQKRNIQISRAANSYVTVAEEAPAAAAAAPPRPPGVVNVSVSIVDLGERKDAFGHTARRIRTVMQRDPQPGACDMSKVLTQTDGWYIETPKVLAASPQAAAAAVPSGCTDEIKIIESGDSKLIGFPIGYTASLTDLTDKDAKAVESSMEVTEFEVLKLDAALFDIPAGLTAAADPRAFTRTISDANETRLASGAAASVAPAKQPGALRVGVPEVANKTTQETDTRALRTRMISELQEQKIEAVPMAAGTPAELDARARELGVDYLLLSEITELKVSKPGGFTKVLKATAKEDARDITEAKLNVQLVPLGGRPRLSKSASGKDGGVGLKTGLKVAKFAGKVYLKFYMGGMMAGQLSAFSSLQMMNMGGMGSMGSMMPMGAGGNMDRTAGAANYVMQQVMSGASAGSQSGPSFDAALENAIEDAGKDVAESIKRSTPVRK